MALAGRIYDASAWTKRTVVFDEDETIIKT
jgi:hypothetical protein